MIWPTLYCRRFARGLALFLAVGVNATVNLAASATVRPCLTIEKGTASVRPTKHPNFVDAMFLLQKRKLSEEQWLEVADLMCQAEVSWPEDGKLIRMYSRRFSPYLPRYYLSVALYEIGCYKAARDLLERSVLRDLKGKKIEYDNFVEKLESSTDRIRRGEWQKEGADCSDWQEPKGEPAGFDER